MTGIEDQQNRGKEMLKEVAVRYASQHGLRPDTIEWVCQAGEEWWLRIITAEHTVRVVFSLAEIEDFPTGGPATASSKMKIRNAFASLAM